MQPSSGAAFVGAAPPARRDPALLSATPSASAGGVLLGDRTPARDVGAAAAAQWRPAEEEEEEEGG